MKALLALEDGRIFPCRSFTGPGEAWGEVVFNTSMTGYQEVLTDPSYCGQMVTMTYPLIGNYGVNPEDIESDRIQVSAFIIKEYQNFPSNYRATQSLAEYLKNQNIIGIEDLDTRALTRHLRKSGAMRGYISTRDLNPEKLIANVRKTPSMIGQDLVKVVSTKHPYFWENNTAIKLESDLSRLTAAIWKHSGKRFSVVVFDYGVKYNILRCLEKSGCEVLVIPATTSAETVKALQPNGIFLSNGPGDPEPVDYAIETIKALLGFRPMFGICLGNQLLGLAMGGKTFKLKFGHRGANQPVKNLLTNRVEITSQNHGFAVDTDSMQGKDIELTHINLNDNTFEGFKCPKHRAFSVQYHPEASPGPHDANYLFHDFVQLMKDNNSI